MPDSVTILDCFIAVPLSRNETFCHVLNANLYKMRCIQVGKIEKTPPRSDEQDTISAASN